MSDGKINASLITNAYRDEFLDYLTSVQDDKTIVWDEPLTQSFNMFTNTSSIKSTGVEGMVYLDTERPSCKTPNFIFIVRPQLLVMEKVASFILRVKKEEKPFEVEKKKFHILFVPRRSLMCEKRLKDLEVLAHIKSIDELPLDLFPLDNDLLTMDLENSFKECFLDNNPSCLYNIAKSLTFLQSLYGVIPNVVGKGDMANRVIDIMLRMKKEMEPHEPNIPPRIDNLLLLDRMVDPVTPLMTQLTYEGLIDELFGISKGSVNLPASKFTSEQQTSESSTNPFESSSSEMKKIPLNSSEQLFADLRDRNFNAVGSFLSQRVKLLRVETDERHAAKSVGEIKKFVSKLPHIQAASAALNIHTTIAQMIKDIVSEDDFRDWILEQHEYLEGKDIDKSRSLIEDAILNNEPFVKVLRMICLQCICNDGFKPKLMEFYLRELIQNYGYHHIATLSNLEKVGILRTQDQTKTFATIAKAFKLLVRGTNELRPEDVSYVYSIYAPLSVRLTQLYNKLNWRSITDSVNDILPGKMRAEIQPVPAWLQKRDETEDQGRPGGQGHKVTLVFFIGGVTFAEVSAFRFLSHLDDGTTSYIIATTNVINGNTWLESLSENLKKESLNPFSD